MLKSGNEDRLQERDIRGNNPGDDPAGGGGHDQDANEEGDGDDAEDAAGAARATAGADAVPM